MCSSPNKPAPANPAIASRFRDNCQQRGVAELERSATPSGL